MKKTLLALIMMVSVVTLNAQLLKYEGFDYPVNDTLPQHGWVGINSGDSIVVVNGSLDYTGLVPSVGNKIAFGSFGRDYQYLITSQATGTVYMSYILKVTDITSLDATGGYFTGLGASTTNFCATTWTKKGTTGYFIGLNARTTAAYTTWDTQEFATGTTVFVVVSYEMISGTTNDIAKMWINPASTSFGTATPPAATITITNGGTDLTPLERFFIRQDSPTETPDLEMDEIRVGMTWADVTPAPAQVGMNETAKSGIYPNPAANQITFSNIPLGAQYEITDINGKTVVASGQYLGQPVNVEMLRQGVYNLRIITREGVIRHTFIKE